MMRVVVTGSRHWNDLEEIHRVMVELPEGTLLIHGGAAGADNHAHAVADDLGFDVHVEPAWWDKHGRSAGPRRNQKMIDMNPHLVLAFPLPGSRGTWDCVRRAERAGIEVRVCRKYLAPDLHD